MTVSPKVSAQNDTVGMTALTQTLELLVDPKARETSIKSLGPAARKADDGVVDLVGGDPQKKEEIYKISSMIFRRIVAEANGDPTRLQELLEEAARNPSQFMQKMTPEERKQIKSLAESIEASKTSPLKK